MSDVFCLINSGGSGAARTATASSQVQNFPYVLSHPKLHKQINKTLAPIMMSHALLLQCMQ